MNINLLKTLISYSTEDTMLYCYKVLNTIYNTIYANTFYIYAIGNIPICLVAHADTLRSAENEPVAFQQNDQIITNTKGILGADDRAGIYAILSIISKINNRPSILITNFEERGFIGVKKWITDNVWSQKDILFIELDRHGKKHYTTYNGPLSIELQEYLEKQNLPEMKGICSDIYYITDAFHVPSINCAIGYYYEHTSHEYLDLIDLKWTINKISFILKNYHEIVSLNCPQEEHISPLQK